MSNVLPPDAKKKLGMRLHARFVFVTALMLFLGALVAILSLVPAYLSVRLARDSVENADREVPTNVREDQDKAARAQAFVDALAPIVNASSTPTNAIATALSLRPTDVRITSVSYSRNSLVMSGTSKSREELNEYREALQAEGSFKNVAVPVAALVGAQDGRFTITLSGAF